MTKIPSKNQLLLAQIVLILVVACLVFGISLNGSSAEVRHRFWQNLIDRPGGPLSFRIVLQPMMAAIAALFDGIEDARSGRSPYFWTVLTNREERAGRLREGIIVTARIILLGLIMDLIYQIIVLGTFYPAEAATVAIVLCFIPYLLLRGPFARIAHWWFNHPHADSKQ
jgi:hypothetical protein